MNGDTNRIRILIYELACAARSTCGDPGLPPEDRPALVAHLKRVLVNWDELNAYGAMAEEVLEGIPGGPDLGLRWEDAETEEVLGRGLDALDNGALARLALDPYTLVGLYEQIQGQFRPAW